MAAFSLPGRRGPWFAATLVKARYLIRDSSVVRMSTHVLACTINRDGPWNGPGRQGATPEVWMHQPGVFDIVVAYSASDICLISTGLNETLNADYFDTSKRVGSLVL